MVVKSLARSLVRFGLRCIDSSPQLRRFFDREICAVRGWRELDQLYTACRRQLNTDPDWRYSPKRVGGVGSFVLDSFVNRETLREKVYCEFGCGTLNPYASAAFIYLNGASGTWSLDVCPIDDPQRAAEALADLLVDCAARPDFWHRSDLSRDEYFQRWRSFNLAKLRDGDLEGGLAGLPFRFVAGDIRNNPIPAGSVDLLSSESVVEHVEDLPLAAKCLYEMMAPGGVAAHFVDVVDHRWYIDSKRYHKWSFIEEEGDEALKSCECNGLRCAEIMACFEKAGFEVQSLDRVREPLPAGLRKRARGRYASMSDDELETVGFNCVLMRPLASPKMQESGAALQCSPTS